MRTMLSFLAVILLLAGCGGQGESPSTSADMAPDFTLKNLDGRDVSLRDFRGKIVLLDFWATWCPPCIQELPHFVELYDAYKVDGFEIIGIALDAGGVSVVKPFIEERGIEYTTLIGTDEVTQAYGGVRGIPTTFIIDREGKIYKKYQGYRDKSVFENDIKRLLGRS
ncbi:hypothetical protein AMJ39_07185 [candidate division TA06 bacterium DG_24]|jgi:peroxiredoxin|uniref:Thioredoxin domain-containing protein n=3 Tax=Bacteria division TA06 TaxID=1156500 RepID=A0A0S8JIC1_UNCT6|nr:MAG: hypothetical protein AMJ39_07185 [candidate division TA06 bacterium DG_24]KPK66257.1 MAG: hypothetical protein AMJ82_11940 [candidate division TA06 bacterium SM23_40]KPL09416.1 MAG: hypothetical protein AMJ71_06475 [candidate division TA06 bacterium SM1_40]